jgi:Holliday junction resolvase
MALLKKKRLKMRRAARTDNNHEQIVKALRAVGATVQSLAAVGQGVPDLLVGYQGKNILVEIKDGSKTPSRRKLTDDQVKWHESWNGGAVAVVDSVDAAWAALGIMPKGNV